ncbi:hypothetical protein [Catenovulum sediminis]|uniref:Uncharacterized protein n=1 Tax=Catenovulum sediminis TaxID=1740262 RepID=A0ABV1RFN0_9ALTE
MFYQAAKELKADNEHIVSLNKIADRVGRKLITVRLLALELCEQGILVRNKCKGRGNKPIDLFTFAKNQSVDLFLKQNVNHQKRLKYFTELFCGNWVGLLLTERKSTKIKILTDAIDAKTTDKIDYFDLVIFVKLLARVHEYKISQLELYKDGEIASADMLNSKITLDVSAVHKDQKHLLSRLQKLSELKISYQLDRYFFYSRFIQLNWICQEQNQLWIEFELSASTVASLVESSYKNAFKLIEFWQNLETDTHKNRLKIWLILYFVLNNKQKISMSLTELTDLIGLGSHLDQALTKELKDGLIIRFQKAHENTELSKHLNIKQISRFKLLLDNGIFICEAN